MYTPRAITSISGRSGTANPLRCRKKVRSLTRGRAFSAKRLHRAKESAQIGGSACGYKKPFAALSIPTTADRLVSRSYIYALSAPRVSARICRGESASSRDDSAPANPSAGGYGGLYWAWDRAAVDRREHRRL
jgi:hypothetical protein